MLSQKRWDRLKNNMMDAEKKVLSTTRGQKRREQKTWSWADDVQTRGVHPMGGNEAEIFIIAILEGDYFFAILGGRNCLGPLGGNKF